MQIFQASSILALMLSISQTTALALPSRYTHAVSTNSPHGITLVHSSFEQAQDKVLAFGTRPTKSALSQLEFHSTPQANVISELEFHELLFGSK